MPKVLAIVPITHRYVQFIQWHYATFHISRSIHWQSIDCNIRLDTRWNKTFVVQTTTDAFNSLTRVKCNNELSISSRITIRLYGFICICMRTCGYWIRIGWTRHFCNAHTFEHFHMQPLNDSYENINTWKRMCTAKRADSWNGGSSLFQIQSIENKAIRNVLNFEQW